MIEPQPLFDDSKARRPVTVGAFIIFNGDAHSAIMIGRSYYISFITRCAGLWKNQPINIEPPNHLKLWMKRKWRITALAQYTTDYHTLGTLPDPA